MVTATSKRRGHGEDSIYWDASKGRYTGAVSLGFSPAGTRIRKKVTGRTKAEVRNKLRELCRETAAAGRATPPPDGHWPGPSLRRPGSAALKPPERDLLQQQSEHRGELSALP